MPSIIMLLHNIRSTYNVGSIFRTADGFGVEKIILSGYTPYPALDSDNRLPHITRKLTKQIHKTALGAENSIPFNYQQEPGIDNLKNAGYRLTCLEQHPKSISLNDYSPPDKIALLLGEEVNGINSNLLAQADDIIEIPMLGQKESFNVSVAAGIALYSLTTH